MAKARSPRGSKTITSEPRKNKNLKAVMMVLDNIAHQYRYRDSDLKHSPAEIAQAIETEEQEIYFQRLKNIQIELINWINRTARIARSANGRLDFIKQCLELLGADELDNQLKNGKVKSQAEAPNPIIYENSIFNSYIENIVDDLKEYTVLTELLYQIGYLWDIGTFMAIGEDRKNKLEAILNKMSEIPNNNVYWKWPVLDEQTIEKFKKDVSNIQANAPLTSGYFTGFGEYEARVNIRYGANYEE